MVRGISQMTMRSRERIQNDCFLCIVWKAEEMPSNSPVREHYKESTVWLKSALMCFSTGAQSMETYSVHTAFLQACACAENTNLECVVNAQK